MITVGRLSWTTQPPAEYAIALAYEVRWMYTGTQCVHVRICSRPFPQGLASVLKPFFIKG